MGVRLNKVLCEFNIGFQTVLDYLKSNYEVDDKIISVKSKITDDQYNSLCEYFSYLKKNRHSKIDSQSVSSSFAQENKNQQNQNKEINPLQGFDWGEFEKSAISRNTAETVGNSLNFEHTIINAKIISKDNREIIVNLGNGSDAIVPASEFLYNPNLQVGDVVEVYVEKQDNHNGIFQISHKKARLSTSWEKICKAFDNNETINCYVKWRTKGGMIVDLYGVEAFLPGSHIDIIKVTDYDVYVGNFLDVKVIKINKQFKNIMVSHKLVVIENLEKKTTDKTLLKEIWQKHTEVQEQILRQRTKPLTIMPSMTEIINEKLHVCLDTTDNTTLLQNTIIEALDIGNEYCHFNKGYVFAPISNWSNLDESIKSDISSQANREYVSFSFYPVIDGKITDKKAQFTEVKDLLDKLDIDYDFDRNRRLQISINELKRLKDSEEFGQLQISLPEVASAVIPIYPSILYYLERLCPNHNFKNVEVFKEYNSTFREVNINKELIVEGGYFNDNALLQLNKIFDLRMSRVEFAFKIHDEVINNYDWKKNKLGFPKLINNTLTFSKVVKNTSSEDIDYDNEESDFENFDNDFFNSRNTNDINFEFTIDSQIINKIFGKGNYDITERYFYKYQENRNWATAEELDKFNDQLQHELNGRVSIEKNGTSIGIDFNWKEHSLPDLLTQLSREFGFIDFSLYKRGHKCNFDIQYKKAELTNIMEELHNAFEDLNIELIKKGTELSFFKEFDSIDDLIAFKPLLVHKLNTIDSERYSSTIFEVPVDCVKLLYYDDKKSRDEERVESIRELKGADFTVGDLTIGRLIRISGYPEVVLDISGDNFENTKQLFEKSEITQIMPDLTGDLEKLARLKESLNRIIQGREIENASLSDFIFDASKARGIKDFDENLRLELQEISKHILNEKIDNNIPQKTAIAKALLAPDLALIQGPPGTGKSTAIAEIIWQHTRKFPNKRILLTSETNLAVDNAIDRVVNKQHNLIKPIRIGDESRLGTEGLQFSYPAMYKWAKGEDWKKKKHNINIDDEDDNEIIEDEDSIYEFPEKLILLNWMENIERRMDKERMPTEAQQLWKELLNNPTPEVKNLFFENYVANCNVIGATCSSIGQKNIILTEAMETKNRNRFKPTKFYSIYRQLFSKRDGEHNPKIRFDMVIQDESSKATPAELSLPLIYGVKNVIIGDHRQLPPMLSLESFINSFDYLIKREKSDGERKKTKELRSYVLKKFKTLEISHFERLYNQIDDNLKGVFNYQFRMHPAINDVIKQFYNDDGGLECGLTTPIDLGVNDPCFINNSASRYHGIIAGPISPDIHVLWIDSSSPEMLDGTSRVNYGEVQIIKKLLIQLNDSESFHRYTNSWTNLEDKQIGLISFYGKQIRLLKDMIKELNCNQIPIRISTVDRFQGMERNIIIVSMVRSHCIQTEKGQKPNFKKYPESGYPKQEDLGFAQSPNRLNVALSRAKRLLIIVGDSKLFRTKNIYDNVYNSICDPHNNYGKIITAQEYGL